jgi:hypothetical protein
VDARRRRRRTWRRSPQQRAATSRTALSFYSCSSPGKTL